MKFKFGKLSFLHDHLRMVKHKSQRQKNHQSVLAIIAELGSESNAHGLAKIATTRKTNRKVMWALLVIIGFTAATLQLSLLVRKYLQFNVVEVSQMKDGMPVEFPAVSICNIHATSLTKVKQRFEVVQDYHDWFEFLKQVTFGPQQSRVESTQGFYENLMDEAKIIGHDLQDMLLHCRFNEKDCHPSNFSKYFDGKNYYNCYTFNSGKDDKVLMHATGPQNGLSMIISLDNDDPPLGTFGLYNLEDNVAHSAGIRVQIHAPNTMPSPSDHGFDVPPGYSSSVGLKTILHTRQSHPYGNCTDTMLRGKEEFKNTIFSCLQLCKQRIVIDRCNCISSGLPGLPGVTNKTYCGTIKDWKGIARNLGRSKNKVKLFVKELKCEVETLHHLANDRTYERDCKCFQPCKETSYQKSLSLSYWPLEFYQKHGLEQVYGNKINKTFMNEAFRYLDENIKKYLEIWLNSNGENTSQLLKPENMPLDEKQKIARASAMIHQNLLRLNVYLEDLSVVEFLQMPAYELEDLLADIGGTLGLWMGISVLTIMELVELIIRLVMLLFNAENKIPDPSDPLSNGMLEHTDAFDGFDKEFEGFERNDYRRNITDNPQDSPV